MKPASVISKNSLLGDLAHDLQYKKKECRSMFLLLQSVISILLKEQLTIIVMCLVL